MDFKEQIEKITGEEIRWLPAGSGVVETASGRRFFLKRGSPSPRYRCEAAGLAELSTVGGASVPEIFSVGEDHILTQYIEQEAAGPGFYTSLARMVAAMHRVTARGFGFREDNFIGATPQPNLAKSAEVNNWAEFYWNKRLVFQIELARRNGYGGELSHSRIERLRHRTYQMLSAVDEPPSLLHGDLWGGNYICGPAGVPYLIDPAVYYGHRETDIAMTMLFGGFSREFYQEYNKEFPLREGWRSRVEIYKLYHVLNHLNLFGPDYLSMAVRIIDSL